MPAEQTWHIKGHRKRLAFVVRDQKHPTMWRVELPDGRQTDMVNYTRANDAARKITQDIINNVQLWRRAAWAE